MEWSTDDISKWLTENNMAKFVEKFTDEEIDGCVLFGLSAENIEQLLPIETDGVIKKSTIGAKIIFESKLRELKNVHQPAASEVINLNLNDTESEEFFRQFGLSDTNSTSTTASRSIAFAFTYNAWFAARFVSPRRKFPLQYLLPTFDHQFELAAQQPTPVDFGPRCSKKQQLVKTIRDDVVNKYGTDYYPTPAEFDRMVVAVKIKYLQLCHIFGDDMVSAEENNQPLESAMKLEEQAQDMAFMIHNSSYDLLHIKSKMDLTYSHRQHLLSQVKPFEDTVESYPALRIPSICIREIDTHCGPYGGSIIDGLKSHCKKLAACLAEKSQKENIDEYWTEEPFIVLDFIMKRFKESKKLMLNYEPLDAFPMLQMQTTNGVKRYSLVIEYKTLFTSDNHLESLASLIGSFEIFNIQYPVKLQSTLEVLNGLAFDKRTFPTGLACKRFFKEFQLQH
ncbi:unnamed protein product [Didymodactylos carnosus]|uniref:SAM domain-containing protein n=1 Tax=Didymodactylos carnosus TaxID=1234261 RepID=A0A815A9D7_9BILA|nr:unnamed protein product [Didymodactylos carnosus]CAF1254297.1 unnamed protein product [Didymodactylos carnosus]CAF3617137.1 unnamed protein product [Didymodactylos carnosus]CAF4025580.1 unnamed protein product [Didymodactylos carnosus]